jgi:hypothetical protein
MPERLAGLAADRAREVFLVVVEQRGETLRDADALVERKGRP